MNQDDKRRFDEITKRFDSLDEHIKNLHEETIKDMDNIKSGFSKKFGIIITIVAIVSAIPIGFIYYALQVMSEHNKLIHDHIEAGHKSTEVLLEQLIYDIHQLQCLNTGLC